MHTRAKTKNILGAWIAEWSSHSTFEHQYATPWAMRLILGEHNIYAQLSEKTE